MAPNYFVYIHLPYYNWSKSIDFVKVNGFRCFVISSYLFAGQFSDFKTLLLRSYLWGWSSVHWLIKWSVVWSPFLQVHVASSKILNRWRWGLVFPCPVTSAAKIGFMSICNLSLSFTFGKNSFVIAAFIQFFHSFCHFYLASSSISLYSVLSGILLKTTVVSLFRAAAFSSWSSSSFPYIPTWAVIHENSIVQFALSQVDIFFLVASMT